MANLTTTHQRYKLIVSGILFIWTLSVFLPGAYSIDSWNQFREASTGHYDDWYGTGYASTWRFLWLVSGNFMSLYVVQMSLYWLFFTALLWNVKLKSLLYWLALMAALFFCLIPQYVMRDSLMVLAWALALLILMRAGRSEGNRRRNLAILALLLLAYGFWIRINMMIAILPLIYSCLLLLPNGRIARWKRLLLTGGIGIGMFFGGRFVTYTIQQAERVYPEYKLKLLDLTGISMLSGENCFPASIRNFSGFHPDTLYRQYTPANFDDIYWPDNRRPIFPYPNDSLNHDCTISWRAAILRHPLYYLENRWNGFLYYLHLRTRFKPAEYYNVAVFWIQPDGPVTARAERTLLKRVISKLYSLFYYTPLFAPWFWLLLNIVACAGFFYLHRKNPDGLYWLLHACIQLSGVLFVFSQFVVYQSDRDFRFSYWSVFVALFAAFAFFSRPKSAAVLIPSSAEAAV